jgi:hypothetical protein
MDKKKMKFDIPSALTVSLLVIVLWELLSIFDINLKTRALDSATPNSLNQYAQEVIITCSKESDRPICYDKEIPKLMDKISMEDAFKVTAIVQAKDSSYPFCHVLGHNLSAKEVAKDPSKWKDVLTRCPSGQCSNGCLHGGLQERFRGSETYTEEQMNEVIKELSTICEKRGNWNPTGLEQASCYHAVGHLSMYLTGADIIRSGEVCRQASVKEDGRNYLKTCYDGTFMQIFQPLEDEDKELIIGKEVKKNELENYCRKYSGEQRASCWHEGWPLYSYEILKPEGLLKFCTNPVLTNESDINQCFLSLFYVIVVQFNFDISKLKNFCSSLPNERIGQCFSSTASRLIETDYENIGQSANYCSSAPTEESRSKCYNELIFYSTFNFHPGSEEFYVLCNNLPQDWKDKCLAGDKK